ncbi:hypothetical protein ACFSTA_12285 [Ornithinibacillus salinisoli]|uniref:PilZ domain-containing protein n=2 Tax=Ornithinibacillus salinisoli TaxID=1848459 RepID=A0ABW4W2N9_9BACI
MKIKKDYFRDAVQTLCKVEIIPPRITRFTKQDNFITISIKNVSEDGLDINCFKVINIIYSLIGPTKTKFSRTPFLFPDSQKIDRIAITFEEKEYKALINKLFNQNTVF